MDHYSGLSYVHLQKSTSALETVEAKDAFERYTASHGAYIHHYHADNGCFADNMFRQAVARKGQTLSFCGVNAHFQNGVAERRIRELQDHARCMLIHAQKRWSTAITTNLWPYALRMANNLHNETPSLKYRQSPLERFTGTQVSPNPRHWHHFGAPAYVLASDVASGKHYPKWTDRARVGIYLGPSPQHARSVALVLSLTTGLSSPQFHVSIDDSFQTMRSAFGASQPASMWQTKCKFIHANDDQVQHQDNAIPSEGGVQQQDSTTIPSEGDAHRTSSETGLTPGELSTSQPQGAKHSQYSQLDTHRGTQHAEYSRQLPHGPPPEDLSHQPESSTSGLRRSTRAGQPPQRLIEALEAQINTDSPSFVAYEALYEPNMSTEFEDQDPLLVFASSADPDTMYLHEAMKQPDKAQFKVAMQKEVDSFNENKNWTLVHRSKVPQGSTVLPAVWQMKRKRRIATREIYKWKARLNLDGSKQIKGVNYWDTYAPVTSWPTVRLLLTMAIIQGWHTKQLDFVLAFTQAPVEIDNLYMKIPRGFHVPNATSDTDYLLKVEKNIYGQKQAGRVWNKHLVSKLTSKQVGFTQSQVDECVFYKGSCIYVLYTDDSILAGPDETELEQLIQDMQKAGLKLTVEGDITDFLGVQVDRKSDGTIHMTQPHLIDNILQDLRLDGPEAATKNTPAKVGVPLQRHVDSQPFDGHFDYRSIIGKMNYLEKSTRPDIAYALHQCARFSADPKIEHGAAVKWLGRYLRATRDKGLIFKPTAQSFDCWVDADFAGNWDPLDASHPSTARSRSGFIFAYAGCPIIWKSKMQTIVALSTTESEYIALSAATREVIYLLQMIREMRDHNLKFDDTQPKIHCKVFEDNSGALEMANVHKLRPRTKHLAVSWHHFRHHVTNGDITVLPIDTNDQLADCLTKPNDHVTLRRHRLAIMGW